MLAILSPAKTLDYQTPLTTKKSSQADFNRESSELMSTLRKFAPADIASLMKISDKLAELNHRRYAEWRPQADEDNARPALFAFKGDVYQGLDASSMTARHKLCAKTSARIVRTARTAATTGFDSTLPPRNGDPFGHQTWQQSVRILGH